MIEERLEQIFINLGYRRVDSNTAGIYLFYHIADMELTIVSVIKTLSGTDLSKEQYTHILEQIKNNFHNEPLPNRVRLLSLILTTEVGRVKHLCIDNREDQHWIIDLVANRLIIYETGSNEFITIRDQLEEALTEEERQRAVNQEAMYDNSDSDIRYNPYQGRTSRVRSRFKLFTLINTIIIVINVIAFLILHYTPLFGGEGRMLGKGALSWYYVITEKEYYRILTSMFMHSDFEHLFNNMLVLLFVGDNLERAAGKIKYLFLYFGTGIIAGITSIGYNMWKENGQYLIGNSTFSIGASGAIFGVVGAMLFIVAINRGRLEDISTRQMVLFAIFSLYGGIVNTQIDMAAHVGGFLAGILLSAIVYRRTGNRMKMDQQSQET
jgi:rhomboid protease GluP